MYGGTNRAKWAYINSSGSERSHWGRVHAILQARDNHTSAPSYPATSVFVGIGRKSFLEGIDKKCQHCHREIEFHTPLKKLCPKK
jgi:hypothetical protein